MAHQWRIQIGLKWMFGAITVAAAASTRIGKYLGGLFLMLLLPTLSSGGQCAGCRIVIEAIEGEVVVGEPLVLFVDVTNASGEDIRISREEVKQLVAFKVTENDAEWASGAFINRPHVELPNVLLDPPHKLRAGATYTWDEVFYKHLSPGRGLVFAHPGTFYVKAIISGHTESNALKVIVRPQTPAGSRALEALEKNGALRGLQAGYFLGSVDGEAKLRDIAEGLKRCENSSFLDFAWYELGEAYWHLSSRKSQWSDRVAPLHASFEALSRVSDPPRLRRRAAYRQLHLLAYGNPLWPVKACGLARDLAGNESLTPDPFVPRDPNWHHLFLKRIEILCAEDSRLDKEVEFEYKKGDTFGDLLKRVSLRSGVILSADPESLNRKIGPPGRETEVLRVWLFRRSAPRQYWIQKNGAYVLSSDKA